MIKNKQHRLPKAILLAMAFSSVFASCASSVESVLGRDDAQFVDNHGAPYLVVDNAGYIHVIFGGHVGTKALHG